MTDRLWFQRRTTRRRVLLGVGAAILAVGVAIPVLRIQPVPEPAAPAPPPPVTPAPQPVARDAKPFVVDIDFADPHHGFALRTYCYDVRTPCLNELMVTEDGEHWRSRRLPPRTRGGRAAIDRLWVLSGQEIVVAESFPTASAGRWYSADGGRTWQPVPATVEGLVEAVPPGGVLDLRCADPAVPAPACTRATPVVTMPGTGRLAALSGGPPLDLRYPHTVPVAADGSLWVYGLVPGSDRWAVAASGDSGRTWSVSELPEHRGPPITRLEISVGPDATYAVAVGQLPGITDGLIAIFRSTDGRTWRQTWSGVPDREPSSITGAAVATADRRLIIHTESEVPYVSEDGGQTFDPAPVMPGSQVRWTRIGYLAATFDPSTVYRASTDGTHWREITVE